MSVNQKQTACAQKQYVVHARDLPLSCPADDMVLWNAHPKVYLPIEKTGHCACPYCGAEYKLVND